MTQIFKQLLVTMVVTLLAVGVTTTEATAQVTIASADDIPLETTPEGAQAYYEASTGNVYFSLGTRILLAGIAGVDDELIFENFDNTTALGGGDPAEIEEIAFLILPAVFFPELPNGIFNLGNILPADPSIVDVASFQASPFGAAQLQFSTGAIRGFNDFNVIASSSIPEPSSMSLLALACLGAVVRRRR